MPIELLEAPREVSVTTVPKTVQELGRPNVNIRDFLPDRIRNEFNNTDITMLKPRPIVIEDKPELAEEFNKALWWNFEYYSRTKDLEVGTERTRLIQERVVDRLTAGTGVDTRVVIMRRGKDLNASVVPDGTVFISQSLINRLNSLDEIAAILGHEVGHFINKTSIRATEAGTASVGISWLHEAACDQKNAPELMEKAGFNTWAFGTAILKVSGYGRGIIHQSGLSRASQTVGGHAAIDRTTSSQQEIPIPKVLRGRVSRTNLEIIADKIKERGYVGRLKRKIVENLATPIQPMLEQLHPFDFGAIYKWLSKERNHHGQMRADMRACDQIIINRLEQSGYSHPQINLFLVRNLNIDGLPSGEREEDAYMFKKIEDLTEVVDVLVKSEIDQSTNGMYRRLSYSDSPLGYSTQDQLLKLMAGSIYDVNFENLKEGMPVTKDTLLNSLEKLSQLDKIFSLSPGYYTPTKEQAIGRILAVYVLNTYLKRAAETNTEIVEDEIKDFFQKAKDRGLRIDLSILVDSIGGEKAKYTRKRVEIPLQERNKVVDIAKEVLKIELFTLTTEIIDQFFYELIKEDVEDNEKSALFRAFLKNAQDYLERENITDEKRLEFAKYLGQKIDGVTFPTKLSWLEVLQTGEYLYKDAKETDVTLNDAVIKFNLNMILGTTFFDQDSDQFYTFVSANMDKLSPYLSSLSRPQFINLCQSLFLSGREFSGRYSGLLWLGKKSGEWLSGLKLVNISDHERLFNLSLIKRIMEIRENPNFQTLGELNNYVQLQLSRLILDSGAPKNSLYGDLLFNLVTGREIREDFEKIIAKGIDEKDYEHLYNFLNAYYPAGPQKDQFLREINKHYLRSPDLAFDQKVDYMLGYFNQIGPEAMLILADQIQNIDTYRYFRERLGVRLTAYIEGEDLMAVNVVAGADILSSPFVKEFEKLLMTCQNDPEVSKQTSTEVAGRWFNMMLGLYPTNVTYDANLQKFVLTEESRTRFRTLADTLSTLKGLSDLQKFAIIHKSLTDTNGALTSPENRKKMAGLLTKSLGMEKGFVASVLSAACAEADAKLIGFPASRMLIPFLFKSLDIKAVDQDLLNKTKIHKYEGEIDLGELISVQAISDILQTDTRSISVFGARYQSQPSSKAALLAAESDQQFLATTNRLNELLIPKKQAAQEKERASEIDPAVEAVIKGVESSGTLGIRALQLATQFYSFPPVLEKRLSETFDSNPGLNKLLFWENLNKIALDEAEKGNQDEEQFLQRITLGNYLGGGSLQTTYEAILDAGAPNERRVIVKMKNPNAQKFIEESYISAQDTLGVVSWQGGESAQHARVGMLLMDLSQKWCIDDINDKTFLEDDAAFRDVIAEFNQKEGQEVFYAPENIYTTSQVKSEDLAPGETANQFFNNTNVSFEQKQQVARTLSRFFIHQLKAAAVVEEDGKKLRLVHSDPHIGNYMVDISGQSPKIGVIDRSMYLKLEDADIRVLEKMVLPGNDNDFVYNFINRVLDINKVRGVQRAVVTGQVMTSLAGEYNRQKARGAVNKLDLMTTMISTLSDARHFTQFRLTRMDIPLNLRLMIRNIGAIQELGRRYGVDFEALYHEAA